jgi:hypothetical protein
MRSLLYCLILSFLIMVPLMAQDPAAQPAAQAPAQTAAQPAPQAAEDWLTGSIDVGYRFLTDVRGDSNTYRSVVNLGEGPKLFGADFTIQPTNKRFADRIDIRADSWGGDPYNTFRLDARRQGLYNFSVDYRNIAYFNFLPSYANPGQLNPALPFRDQYGFDVKRRMADFNLDLFPGHRIVPFIAYSRSGGRGSGTTNFVLDANEYTVPTNYSDHTNEARGGVRFEFNRWHATLEGGKLNFRDDQEVFQGSQLPNTGNTTNPFLGEQLLLAGGREKYGVRGGSAFTRGLFTANPVSWADISASFLYSQPHTDVHFTQNASGNFFSLANGMFFNSEILDATGNAKQPNPSASVALTLKPFGGRLRILESWMTNRLHTAGSILLLDQMLVTGAPPTAANLADASRFVANYNQQELNLLFDVTSFLTVRGGHRYVWGDTTAPPSLTIESLGGNSELGTLRRNVALAGLTFRKSSKLRVNVDFEESPGDRTYFRTSLNDYQKARISARWQPLSTLQVTARADLLKNRNPDPLVQYDFLSRDNSLSAYWNPGAWKGFGLLGEYSRTTLRSDIIYLIPNLPNPTFTGFAQDLSRYRENAHTGTLLADVPFLCGTRQPKLSLGGSFFVSSGSRPAQYWQPMARVAVPLGAHVQFRTEWRWYALSQPYYLYEGFRSHQFVTALRFER